MKIAFICVGNSARSQMAEAIAKHYAKKFGLEGVEFYSAGSKPAGYIHPMALKTLKRHGIESEGLKSKKLSEIPLEELDLVFTLCKEEECPYIPGAKVVSWAMPDPAKAPENAAEKVFEETFKEIEKRILKLLKDLNF